MKGMTMTKVNWQPMMSVNCTIKGCKGVLFSVPCSRIEESLGHQVFECDKCHQRYKLLMDGTPDAQVVASRTIIALSANYWGRGDTIKLAMAQLKKSGGKTAKGKMVLANCPEGARVDDMGCICWPVPKGVDRTTIEGPFYIGRDGQRLSDQTKALV